MRKMLVVAAREYRASVQSKAFIMTLVAMPVLWGGSIAAQLVLREKVDTADKRVAVLDRAGKLVDAIAAAAEQRNTQDVFKGDADNRRQVKPRFVVERVDPADVGEPPDSTVKLSDRVRQGEILAFVEIGPEALAVDAPPGRPGIAYHSDSPTYDDLRTWLNPVVSNRIWELRAAAHVCRAVSTLQQTGVLAQRRKRPFLPCSARTFYAASGSQTTGRLRK